MISSTVALAFTAGMVATFNPCGFSLLPAYLGGFVAGDEIELSTERRLARAAGVSGAVSLGFVVVFAAVGVIIDRIASQTQQQLPWVTIVIGCLLVVFGAATVAGWRPSLPIPVPALTGGRGGLGVMMGYGVTYAVASLSCTIGPFLAVTGAALNSSAWEASMVYVSYALGMGLIVLILSLSAALAHSSVATNLRQFSKVAPTIGGVLMVIAGSYAIWYGRWELSVYDGQLSDDPVVARVEKVRLELVAGVLRLGAMPLILFATAAAIATVAWSWGRRPEETSSGFAANSGTAKPTSEPDTQASRNTSGGNADERSIS